jgi:hypothetical protein
MTPQPYPSVEGESMKLVTIENKIVENSHHTLIVMRDGPICQAVRVLNDDGIGSVRSKLSLMETIASRKLYHGEVAFDGCVWITPADLPHPFLPAKH